MPTRKQFEGQVWNWVRQQPDIPWGYAYVVGTGFYKEMDGKRRFLTKDRCFMVMCKFSSLTEPFLIAKVRVAEKDGLVTLSTDRRPHMKSPLLIKGAPNPLLVKLF